MVAKNTSDVVAAELISGVWRNYHGEKPSCLRGAKYETEMIPTPNNVIKGVGYQTENSGENVTLLKRTPSAPSPTSEKTNSSSDSDFDCDNSSGV